MNPDSASTERCISNQQNIKGKKKIKKVKERFRWKRNPSEGGQECSWHSGTKMGLNLAPALQGCTWLKRLTLRSYKATCIYRVRLYWYGIYMVFQELHVTFQYSSFIDCLFSISVQCRTLEKIYQFAYIPLQQLHLYLKKIQKSLEIPRNPQMSLYLDLNYELPLIDVTRPRAGDHWGIGIATIRFKSCDLN